MRNRTHYIFFSKGGSYITITLFCFTSGTFFATLPAHKPHYMSKQSPPPSYLRTPATDRRYRNARKKKSNRDHCPFCAEEPLEEFRHWQLYHNKYPYDAVFKTSHILAPKRHVVDFDDLNWRERREFFRLRRDLLQRYDMMLENSLQRRTKKHHFHMHVLQLKD